ncbi:MAG: hypothetical protein KAU17_15125 [Spirochaetales bacterium]|nr:hypothetical protein [Spirochaetales bacterium]
MQTVTENLKCIADDIQNLLEDLLLKHSSIYLWNTPGGAVVFVSTYGNYAYNELNEEGRQIQAKLLEEYRRFYSLLTVLLKEQPKDTLKKLSRSDTVLTRTIEQNKTWCKNTQEAFDKAAQALQAEFELLSRLFDPSEEESIYVPDTNALLYNLNIESWAFPSIPKFTIVLLPTVLSELDFLKVNHRNDDVRKKAETIIRKIKEYRRRGKLTETVTVVKDKIMLQAIAIEPDMETTLQWLDPENNDDRILAGVIEIMRVRPRSIVTAVSRDINFQNKAEFAAVPYEEPPEPV